MANEARDRLMAKALFWGALVLALGSALPVLVSAYPQMSDYPAHLARYGVMLDALGGGARDPDLARHYDFVWAWTGNLGVDLLIWPFAKLFGLETGGRVIVALIAPINALGLMAADYALRRRVSVASLLAMPFVWSPMMLIGLINFALGQGLALWVFALWVWWREPGRVAGQAAGRLLQVPVFAALAVVVWLCHLSAWGILGILVFGYEIALAHSWRARLRACFAPWPLAAPVAIMLAIPGTASSFSYGANVWIYKQAIWMKAMRDTAYGLDMGGLIAVALMLAGAVLWRRVDLRLGLAGLLLLGLTLAVPRHISGGDYADYRLITAGLMVCVLALDTRGSFWGEAGAGALAGGYFALRLAVTTLNWQADSATTARFLQALDHVPRGARVASAVVVDRRQWGLNHFEHIGAYATVRRQALVNAHFAVAHVHMLQIKGVGRGFVDPSQRLLMVPSQKIDLAHFAPAEQADYLWYVGQRAPDTMPAGARLLWAAQSGGHVSFLAKLAAPLAKSENRD